MNAVGDVSRAGGRGAMPPSAGGGQEEQIALLPAPEGFNIDDALTVLMKLGSDVIASRTSTERSAATAQANARAGATNRKKVLLDRLLTALREAAEAKNSGSFFDFYTDKIGLTGFISMCVGGGGFLIDWMGHQTGVEDNEADAADMWAAGSCVFSTGIGLTVYAGQQLAKELSPELRASLKELGTVTDDEMRMANKIANLIAHAVGSIIATIFTAGAAAPMIAAVAAIVISTVVAIMHETGALEKLFGEDAKWVKLGADILALAMTLYASISNAAQGGAQVASTATEAVVWLDRGKKIAESVYYLKQGLDNLEAAELQRDADGLRVDVRKQEQLIDLINDLLDDTIESLKVLKKSEAQMNESFTTMFRIRNETQLTIARARI